MLHLHRQRIVVGLLSTCALACATSAHPGTAPRDEFETTLPSDWASEAKPAAHTSFVPRKPTAAFRPLEARYVVALAGAGAPIDLRFARDGARVYSGAADGRTGWYFLQNPLDPAQFKAWRIDGEHGLSIEHSFADLVNEDIATSWDEVACRGIDPPILAELRDSGDQEEAFGWRFTRLVADEPRADSLVEVWWSAELLLPLRVVRSAGKGSLTQSLIELRTDATGSLLTDPAARFPDLRVVDLADWREDNHDHKDH